MARSPPRNIFPATETPVTDSHLDLSRTDADRKRLDEVELVPFRAAIAAGVSSVMTGHLSVPALEPNANIPATLSHEILTGLLRKKMRFDGLIVTDALDMAGVAARFSPGEVAVRAILAGADVLLMSAQPRRRARRALRSRGIRTPANRARGRFRQTHPARKSKTRPEH